MRSVPMDQGVLNIHDFYSGYRFIGYTPTVSWISSNFLYQNFEFFWIIFDVCTIYMIFFWKIRAMQYISTEQSMNLKPIWCLKMLKRNTIWQLYLYNLIVLILQRWIKVMLLKFFPSNQKIRYKLFNLMHFYIHKYLLKNIIIWFI